MLKVIVRSVELKKVIIAEKPSVGKNIADALGVKSRRDGYFEGEEYIITWVFGHLLQLYDARDYDENMRGWRMDKFPFIPESFEYKIKTDRYDRNSIDKGAEKQLNTIKSLIDRPDVDGIISATDYDREGQVIGDELFIYFDEKKPVYRILLNEWTEDEVKKGMANLKPNSELKSLQDAGIGRQWADWIIGINLTSVATLRYGGDKKILNIGRVLLPTLKIIYDRDKEIESFKPSTYYKLIANFITKDNIEFEGLYYEDDNEKFDDKKVLTGISKLLKDADAEIIEKQVEKKRDYAPLLFNLSNLQGHITSKYKGWTSDKVLKVAQSLYENKFITYPRTGSLALEESLKEKMEKVLNLLKKGLPYEEDIKFTDSKRIFNNKKVEGHSAIVPTYIKPTKAGKDEMIVYNAIKDRFIMQFLPLAEYEETRLTTKIDSESIKGVFISRGKVQIVEGWRLVEKIETKDIILPMLAEKDRVSVCSSKVNTVTKRPPKSHIEKTLLRVMETCGKAFKEEEEDTDEMMESILSGFSIGTPATRAETIKKLKDVGYIEAKGKNLVCTDLGKTIVEVFPCKELLDLEYTGKLEKTLFDIEKGKFKKEDFIDMVKEFTINAVNDIKNDLSMVSSFKVELEEGKESIGKCPACGNDVVENERNFGCINWKNGCRYTIWKDDKFISSFGKTVSKDMVELLLSNGKVGFRNLKSKKGTMFSAYFKYVFNEKTGYYSWELEFI